MPKPPTAGPAGPAAPNLVGLPPVGGGAKPPTPAGGLPPVAPTSGLPPAGGAGPKPPLPSPPSGTAPAATQPPGAAAAAPTAPKKASTQKPYMKYLKWAGGGVAVLLVLVFGLAIFGGRGGNNSVVDTPPVAPSTGRSSQGAGAADPTTGGSGSGSSGGQTVSLTYWSLWEPCSVFEEVFADFEAQFSGVVVNCQQQVSTDYRERLQTAIASRSGPDVFRYHASWTPMLSRELAPLPSSIMSAAEYRQTFYPIAEQQLQVDNQLVGIPLMYDGLVLYYNQDLFQTAGLTPPRTWSEVRDRARLLRLESGGSLSRGGIALGTASNVEHFSDILGLLILQNGGDPADPTDQRVVDAVKFYTNFASSDPVWSDQLPRSTVAFARGEVAMMIAPSWRAHEVETLNPDLNFGVTGVPQLSAQADGEDMTWATYWAEGVSAQSQNQTEAWELLKFMASAQSQQDLFSAQSQIRGFGEPFSRQDLVSRVGSNEVVSAVLSEAGMAQNWYLNSFTHDNGLNDQIIKYYEDAINAVLAGTEAESAMQTVAQGTQQVLNQYGGTQSGAY